MPECAVFIEEAVLIDEDLDDAFLGETESDSESTERLPLSERDRGKTYFYK